MPKRKRDYTWYAKPLDKKTNDFIAGLLPQQDEDFCVCLGAIKGMNILNAWRCKHQTIQDLKRNKEQLGLKYIVYVQEGDGQPREWKFGKKKKKLPKKLQQAIARKAQAAA